MTKKSPTEKNSIKSQLKGINAQYIHKKRTVKISAGMNERSIPGEGKLKPDLENYKFSTELYKTKDNKYYLKFFECGINKMCLYSKPKAIDLYISVCILYDFFKNLSKSSKQIVK